MQSFKNFFLVIDLMKPKKISNEHLMFMGDEYDTRCN